jgi:probable phosphomutase (TIGR03848 family)
LADVPLAAIVSSPLERTRQTAAALLVGREDTPLHVDESLNECDYGDWSGRELMTLIKESLWTTIQIHPAAAAFPGGEAMAGMSARAVTAIRRWNAEFGENATYAVVSHGDLIKAIVADALGMHLDLFQRLHADPCSVSVIRYTDNRQFVLRLNDTGGDVAGLIPPKPQSGPTAEEEQSAESDAQPGGGAGAD